MKAYDQFILYCQMHDKGMVVDVELKDKFEELKSKMPNLSQLSAITGLYRKNILPGSDVIKMLELLRDKMDQADYCQQLLLLVDMGLKESHEVCVEIKSLCT